MKYKNSIFFKFMLSFTIPIALLSLLFSFILYATAMTIINDHVLTQFDDRLTMTSQEVLDELNLESVKEADNEEGDFRFRSVVAKLDELKESYELENVYVMSREGDSERVIALSGSEERSIAFAFSETVHAAIDTGNMQLSDMYEDENGVHKSAFIAFPKSEIVVGMDIDASFVKSIEHWILVLSAALFVLSLIVGAVIAYFISRKTIAPIKQSLAYVNEAASGNLAASTFELKNNDEISQLASGIFSMVGDLRTVIQQVNNNAEHVASTSTQLSASMQQSSTTNEEITSSIHDVAYHSNEQSTSITNVAQSVTTMTNELAQVSAYTEDVAKSAQHTTKTANKGNELIQHAVEQMSATTSMLQNTSSIVSTLSDNTNEIGDIVSLITAIAEQTNLLALNASIEAARAGEHGKGFAVVAEEVRKLADQSQTAASDIQGRIELIKKEAMDASAAMANSSTNLQESTHMFELAGESFNDIYESISTLAAKIDDVQVATKSVTSAVHSISSTIEEVNTSVVTSNANIQAVSDATNEQAASFEEVTNSAANLSQMAEQLRASLQRFHV